MAVALVISGGGALGNNGGTTSSIDTTSADFIAVLIYEYIGGTHGAVTDSKSNSWSELTTRATAGGSQATIFYSVAPTVGSGHTFTYSVSGSYSVAHVLAFSGVDTVSPFDAENGTTGTDANLQPGAVVPSADGALIISGQSCSVGTGSIDSGFDLELSNAPGALEGGYTAFLVQSTAASINPTWTGSVTQKALVIAAFKAAAAAGGQPAGKRMGGVQFGNRNKGVW
jgi:hypothetical protein